MAERDPEPAEQSGSADHLIQAQPLPPPPRLSESGPDAPDYRPVSGKALAGFLLAGLFALGLAVLGTVALATQVPLLLDLSLLAVPVLAFVLSLLGWLQVHRSEGTRVGLRLAYWGMLLSAVSGVGYLTWRIAKEFAVRLEAQAFTDNWFVQLRQGKPHSLDSYIAFWSTLERRDPRWPLHDPRFEQQLRAKPAMVDQLEQYVRARYIYGTGGERARLPRFLDHDLVQLITAAGDQARIEALGIRSWQYLGKAQGGYLVELNYQVATPEGTFGAVVSVLSSETGEGRQWQVLMDGAGLEPASGWQLTPLGETVMALRKDSREFVQDWVRRLVRGFREEAFSDTRPPAERPALGHGSALGQVGGGLAQLACVPGFADFAGGRLVQTGRLLADPSAKPAILEQLQALFRPRPAGHLAVPVVAGSESQLTTPWYRTAGAAGQEAEVVFVQPFSMRVSPQSLCEGRILVATSDPELVRALEHPAGVPRLTADQRSLRWRIAGIEVTVGSIVTPK